MTKEICKCVSIVETLLKHAKGKLCGRYVLGLERALYSVRKGSAKEMLDEQRDWFENRRKKTVVSSKKPEPKMRIVRK